MEKRTSVTKNYIYNLLYNILNILVPLVTAPYTARVLGADRIGIYSRTYAVISMVIMTGALGSAAYGQKEIAGARDDIRLRSNLFGEIVLIKGAFTAFVTLVFLLGASDSRDYPFYLIQSPFLIAAMIDISWFFQGIEKFKYIAVRNMCVRIAGVILLLLFVKSPGDLWKYLLIIGGSQLFGNLSMWPYIRGNIIKPHIRFRHIPLHIRGLTVYFIPSISYQIYAVLDKAMLGWIVGSDYENGYYEQAHKIVNMAVSVITAYTVVMRSRMSFLYAEFNKKAIQDNLKRSANIIALLAFPMSFGLLALARGVVPWFFGDGYEKVTTILCVLSPIFICMGYSHMMGTHILTPSGRQGKSNVGQCTAAGVNVMLNACLIPYLNSIGAAIASVCSELIIVFIYYWMVRKELSFEMLVSAAYKKVIAALIMFFILWNITKLFSAGVFSSFLEVLIGIMVYASALILLRDKFVTEIISTIRLKK